MVHSPELLTYVIAYLSLGLVLLFLSLFVFKKNPRHPLNQIFSTYSLSIAWWSLFTIPLITSHDRSAAYLWDQLCLAGSIFIPTTFLHFVLVFLRQAKRNVLVILCTYLCSAVFLAFNFSGRLIMDVTPRNPFNFYTVPGAVYTVFVGYFSVLSTLGVFLLFRAIIRGKKYIAKPKYLKQAKWLFAASLLGYLGGGTNFLLVYGVQIPFISPVANYAILIYGLAVAYIILRYRFLDIEVIIRKSLVFAGLFSMVMAVVGGVTTVMQELVGRYFSVPATISMAISVMLALLLYEPTRKLLVAATDKYLFQKKEDIRKILNRLSSQIITILDLEKVGKTILETLQQSLRLETGAILVKDENGAAFPILDHFGFKLQEEKQGEPMAFPAAHPLIRFFAERDQMINLENDEERCALPEAVRGTLEQMGAHIAMPLFIHSELIGLLTLGKKKSDEEFKREEMDYFPMLSGQAAIALSNARLYDILKKSEIDFAQQAKMAAIGTLSAGIGHEIKNPLAAIRMGVEMIRFNKKLGAYKDFDKAQYEAVVDDVIERVLSNVTRATGVIDRLSSFAKKPKEIKIEPVTLEAAADSALSLLKQEFEHYNIAVRKEFPSGFPQALADKTQMEDIFLNLFVNARHAIREKGCITVTGVLRDGEVEVAVQDTGSGISKENLEKIFDPFFTTKDVSRNPDQNAIRGTGLGLFLVREFIKKFGGRISVESEPGQGTTFHLFLKAA